MPVFRLKTNLKFKDGGVKVFSNYAIPRIATIIGKGIEYVTLDIKVIERKKGDQRTTKFVVTYFEELNDEVQKILSDAVEELERLLIKYFGEHEFFVTYMSHMDKVLIDWRKRSDVIATVPIDDQGPRRNCWAYVAAYIAGSIYSMEHPSVKDVGEIRCSTQDLSDWVYSFKDYSKDGDIDRYGTYGSNGMDAFDYAKTVGISLLKNYEIEKLDQDRYIETTFHEPMFKEMLASKGERILINSYK